MPFVRQKAEEFGYQEDEQCGSYDDEPVGHSHGNDGEEGAAELHYENLTCQYHRHCEEEQPAVFKMKR